MLTDLQNDGRERQGITYRLTSSQNKNKKNWFYQPLISASGKGQLSINFEASLGQTSKGYKFK